MRSGRLGVAVRRFAALVAATGLLVAVPATQAIETPALVAVAAKACSSGYVHGVINGAEKCLRRGEFCTHSADSQYRRYGFRCTTYYPDVDRYRLT